MLPSDLRIIDATSRIGPAGEIQTAVTSDGTPVQVRFLDRAFADPTTADRWRRRLNTAYELIDRGAVPPFHLELDGPKPFVIVPDREHAPTEIGADACPTWIQEAAAMVRHFHAAETPIGTLHPTLVHPSNGAGVLRIDLTGTAAEVSDEPRNKEDDWAEFAALLKRVSPGASASLLERFAKGDVDGVDGTSAAPPIIRRTSPGDRIDEFRPGRKLGRFELVELIGEGAMGKVFRAKDAETGNDVAVKAVTTTGVKDFSRRMRFEKESRLLARLDSPNVTRWLASGFESDHCWIAMEFVSGRTLGDLLREATRFNEVTALTYAADAARGLAAAHAAGVVHRDVKPDNLLVECEPKRDAAPFTESQFAETAAGIDLETAHKPLGRLKVTDFGVARAGDQSASMIETRAGVFIGTAAYAAPEQLRGDAVDARTDVYALGVTMFQCLTGQLPFSGEDLTQLLARRLSTAVPAVDTIVSGISGATVALVAKCLDHSADRRPIDASAVLEIVEAILAGRTVPGLETTTGVDGKGVDYCFEWDLDSAPELLWPHVSNTERVNRAMGLPSVVYRTEPASTGGSIRHGEARVAGQRMKWLEHPFEWIEGRRMSVVREFSSGPFVWFTNAVELSPRPEGGTRLVQKISVRPRHLIGRMAASVEIGIKAKKNLGRIYKRIDRSLHETTLADRFQDTPSVSSFVDQRLEQGGEKLRQAGVPSPVVETLLETLRSSAAPELARIRPFALAARHNLAPLEVAEGCLRGVAAGLFLLAWDMICPVCRLPAGRKQRLQEIEDHSHCPACASDFKSSLADSVELVFESHPNIRAAEHASYCAGGPAHSPHVAAQLRIRAAEKRDLVLGLGVGRYLLRSPQLGRTWELRIDAGHAVRRASIDLSGGAHALELPTLAPGLQSLSLDNSAGPDLVLRIERASRTSDALTAARAIALQAFRELFPGERIDPGKLVAASSITLLVVRPASLAADDAEAFRTLQSFFSLVGKAVADAGGAVVKSIDETLVSAFRETSAAVRTALELPATLAADSATANLRLQAAAATGLALVATINERLDYFGKPVRTAQELLRRAGENELLLAGEASSDPEVAALVADRRPQLERISIGGVDESTMRVPLAIPMVGGQAAPSLVNDRDRSERRQI